jgi:hypothetical protein
MSAHDDLTPEHEAALAQEFLEINSEEELEHFLPLLLPAIKLAAPFLMKAAVPVLKKFAFHALPVIRGFVRHELGEVSFDGRFGPENEEEAFLGGVLRGLLGETETGEQEQFIGGLLKGLIGGELEGEQEQFLGGILKKVFGGELETENYVQEQFIGGLLSKIFSGELEGEAGGGGHHHRLARRFVRLTRAASRRAALHIMNHIQAGRPPSDREVRRIVFSSIVHAARRFTPRLAAHAFHGRGHHHPMRSAAPVQQAGPPPGPQGPPPGPPPEQGSGEMSMLEMMMADAPPGGAYGHAGYDGVAGPAWARQR